VGWGKRARKYLAEGHVSLVWGRVPNRRDILAVAPAASGLMDGGGRLTGARAAVTEDGADRSAAGTAPPPIVSVMACGLPPS